MEPQQLNTDHFHCIICNKEVKDMYDHMDEVYTESKHKAYEDKVSENGYELPCFCGGRIGFHQSGEDGGTAVCSACDLIWQEL